MRQLIRTPYTAGSIRHVIIGTVLRAVEELGGEEGEAEARFYGSALYPHGSRIRTMPL